MTKRSLDWRPRPPFSLSSIRYSAALLALGLLLAVTAADSSSFGWRVSNFEFRVSELAEQRTSDQGRPIRHVILVSIDGLMPASYTAPDEHGLEVPTLREMVRSGAWSPGALGVFPTVTYPSHTSIATGTNPGTHGIVLNDPWDPYGLTSSALRFYAEDIRVPTLWDAARDAGLLTALIFWPVTVGAQATAVVPEFWREEGTAEDQKPPRAVAPARIAGSRRRALPRLLGGLDSAAGERHFVHRHRRAPD
jgi:hypothetical protein